MLKNQDQIRVNFCFPRHPRSIFFKMKKSIHLLLILFSITLASCGDFEDVTFSGIENVKIVKMSQQGAEAEITAKIKNPNGTAFTIYKSDLDVMLSGINAGKAHLSKNVRIKPHSEETYTFHVTSDFSSLSMSDLPKLMSLAVSKNIKVGLKGNLKVGKLFLKKSYPVDMSQSVPMNLGQ
jgi:LEA14-like dessication related protein